jgi:hypothetical protein
MSSIEGKLERRLQLLADHNIKVNNLFQLDDGTWQCNLRDDEYGYEFGQGKTLYDAIKAAFFLMLYSGGKEKLHEQNVTVVDAATKTRKAASKITLADL